VRARRVAGDANRWLHKTSAIVSGLLLTMKIPTRACGTAKGILPFPYPSQGMTNGPEEKTQTSHHPTNNAHTHQIAAGASDRTINAKMTLADSGSSISVAFSRLTWRPCLSVLDAPFPLRCVRTRHCFRQRQVSERPQVNIADRKSS
jgi:hypothetical protein